MAERITGIRSRASLSGPININYDTGAANAWRQTSISLANVANVLADEADRRASTQAQREGVQAGAFGAPSLRDENTISGEAFNRAAIQSYTNRLELQSRAALTRIQQENPADPAKFMAASKAYMRGVSEEIQGVAPWLVPTFEQRYMLQEQAGLADVTNKYAGLARDSARSDVFQLGEVMRRDHEQNASLLFSDDQQKSTMQMGRMLSDIQRIEGSMNQIGPDGLPLFSKLETQKQIQAMRDNMYSSAVKGYIDKNGSSFGLIQKMIDGKLEFNINQYGPDGQPTGEAVTVNIKNELGDERYDDLVRYAKGQLSFENQMRSRQEDEYAKILEKDQQNNAIQAWARIEGRVDPDTGMRATPLTVHEVTVMYNSGQLSYEESKNMVKAIESPGVDFSDPDTKVEAETMMYQGQDVTSFVNANRDKLTQSDVTKLLTENAKLVTGAPDMASEQRKMLYNSMAVTGPLERVNPVAERRRNNAMTEYDLRVREGESPIAVRTDIENRVDAKSVNTYTSGLVAPRFSVPGPVPGTVDIQKTYQALKNASESGRITKTSYARQLRLLNMWTDAQQAMPKQSGE
jgi:hypothetical protein